MPTIKGGLKLGKHSTQEDLDKLSKAIGRPVFSKHIKPVKKKGVKKK
jgi:hypothetical protein